MNREVFDLLPDIVKGVGKNISRISNKMCRRICQRFCLSARLFGTPGWSQWWSTRDILMAILFWWKVEGWSNTCVGSNSRKTSGSIPCTFNRTNYCDESQEHGNDDQTKGFWCFHQEIQRDGGSTQRNQAAAVWKWSMFIVFAAIIVKNDVDDNLRGWRAMAPWTTSSLPATTDFRETQASEPSVLSWSW